MRVGGPSLKFGWGGSKPLPKPEEYMQARPGRFTDAFAARIAGRLVGDADDCPRFVVLNGKPAPRWFTGVYHPGWDMLGPEESYGKGMRTSVARFLEKVSKAFARQQLQCWQAEGKTDQIVIPGVSYWPGHIAPTDWQKPTTEGQIGVLQFNASKIPGRRYVQIADIRQFCRDKGLKEEDLFEDVEFWGKRLKVDYEDEINKRYTVEINAENASGDEVIVLMNRGDQLYYRYADKPRNFFEKGSRLFRHFLVSAFPFRKGELHPDVEKKHREAGDWVELP